FNLTIDNIMRGNELVGYEPRAVRWSGDKIYFQWKQYNDSRDKDFDTYVVNSDGAGLKKLSEAEAKTAPPVVGEDSKDKRLTVFVEDGDIFIYDHMAGARRQITSTTDIESNAHFTRDQKSIYFTRANNLYVMSLDGGSLMQMTNIPAPGAPATPGAPPQRGGGAATAQSTTSTQKGTDSQEYLKKEERELLDIIRRRAERRQAEEERRKRDNPRKPLQLTPAQTVGALQLTPDGK